MRKSVKIVAVALAAVMVLGAAAVAFANPGSGEAKKGGAFVKMARVINYMSGKSGLSVDSLLEKISAGTTPQELAESLGIDWDTMISELKAGKIDKEKVIARLQERLTKVNQAISQLEGHLAKKASEIQKLEERIPAIKDATRKSFAERHLELMKDSFEIGEMRLEHLRKLAALITDELEYVKSL